MQDYLLFCNIQGSNILVTKDSFDDVGVLTQESKNFVLEIKESILILID